MPRTPRYPWARLSDAELLELRFRDLGLELEASPIAARVRRLYAELAAKGLRSRPHVWLSSEWFSPDGVPGIAVPFYLAHPRLERLERAQMSEVEGGTAASCMRILLSGAGRRPTPASTSRGPTAGASWCTSTSGTRRATRPRTSPRPSPCG